MKKFITTLFLSISAISLLAGTVACSKQEEEKVEDTTTTSDNTPKNDLDNAWSDTKKAADETGDATKQAWDNTKDVMTSNNGSSSN